MMSAAACRFWMYFTLLTSAGLMAEEVQAQTFHVGGSTLKMTQPGVQYSPLPNIHITAWRQGPVGGDYSKADGVIDITLPAGTPVKLLFEGPDDYLPQLQSLAAAPAMDHNVHVTLLTIEQAKEQGINPYEHVKTILDHLRSQGIDLDRRQFRRLHQLLQRLG